LGPYLPYDFDPSVTNYNDTGIETIFYGIYQYSYNIVITNCQFLYGWNPITLSGLISNVLVRDCDFNMWGGPNTNFGNVGIFGGALNMVVISNTFNGNTNLMPSTNGYASTSNLDWIAPAGLVWLQQGGNLFVARNSISNYSQEAVQVNAGPNAVVGNTFGTLCSDNAACALTATGSASPGVTGNSPANYATTFVGNSITGGRHGERGIVCTLPFTLNFSGNSLDLYPPFDLTGDYPGAAVLVQTCQSACVCGNTLVAGGHGFCFAGTNSSALILNNNFGGAKYRGMGNLNGNDQLNTVQIFGNILGQGATFHAQIPYNNSFGWFLNNNTYLDAFGIKVPPFLDPMSSAVHSN
jgi:hypothetical protein